MISCSMPSILKRTRTLSSYGSTWMSLAPRATASFISESTSATTGASPAGCADAGGRAAGLGRAAALGRAFFDFSLRNPAS